MDSKLIAEISRFTLEARGTLEKEASEQLEGLYGWLPGGEFAETSPYPAVRKIIEAMETRKMLEEYSLTEEQAGTSPRDARKKLVRETAFTWLNRLIALRMMEERKLVRVVLSRLYDSPGYLFWLAEDENANIYAFHQMGETPLNEAGEGPRHVAYRNFILWQCKTLAVDIPVLFDCTDLPTRLFPRHVPLKKLVQNMNEESLSAAWKSGNEETIGWVYQAFISEEKDKIFAAFSKGNKVVSEEMGPATQIFTPKWIVSFLIENSLGNLWLEIHPDSNLKQRFSSWVAPASTVRRPLKLARKIRFLDPACGSMHFGIIAFDIFYEMYKEEMERSGQPGWPEKPSVEKLESIPEAIIANNIYGIDIDLRSVQLSALALFFKARSQNLQCAFSDKNLVCANVEPLVSESLDVFLKKLDSEHPIMERILLILSQKLRESGNLGSLIRLETDLKRLIQEERQQAIVNPQQLIDLPDMRSETFTSKEEMDTFFDALESEVQYRLDNFVKAYGEGVQKVAHFVHEASKGLRLMGLMRNRYDVVATNPPYMSRRNQSSVIANFLDEEYASSKSDLYASFLSRCLELTAFDGITAMITQQSFMFISSYETLREEFGREIYIQTMMHLGPRAFDMVTGEKVNTTAFVLRKEDDEKTRREREGVFFRLVHQKNSESKQLTFEEALASYRSGRPHPLVFLSKQKDFEVVPGKPWVYWMPKTLLNLFSSSSLLRDVAIAAVGQNTGDNKRFLRLSWEINCKSQSRNTSTCEETLIGNIKWYPYMKGGKPIPWWGNQCFLINWENDAKELKAYGIFRNNGKHWSRYIQNLKYCFRRGVTWSLISSKGFAARLSPGGFIFDVAGMTCFPPEDSISLVLGVLNSRIAKFILLALNPTINFQVGDIERLPVPEERSPIIDSLVEECVELTRQGSRESEITYEFIAPPESLGEVDDRTRLLSEKETLIDAEVSKLYGLTDEDLFAIERELSGNEISSGEEDIEEKEQDEQEEVQAGGQFSPEEWGRRWISYAVGIALGRFEAGHEGGLGSGKFDSSVAESLTKMASPEGILVNDEGQPNDLAERVFHILTTALGNSEAVSRTRMALGEGDSLSLLRNWFERFSGTPENSFWKYHLKVYRKRPVYWPLQSPGRKFTLWLFHERLTKDTLYSIKNSIVEPRMRLAERRIADLRPRAENERSARMEMERARDLAEDLRTFSANLLAVTERGYTPHIDDGVLLNAAPLWTLLPSWTDTRKSWKELEEGAFDWSHQAMEHWPERVKNACRNNRSFAIAHGMEHLAPAEGTLAATKKRARKNRGA